MAAKKQIKQSKVKQVFKWLKPTSPAKTMVLFIIVFGVAGGTFFAFKSFAASAPGQGTVSASSTGKDIYGCPVADSAKPTLRYGSTGGCVKTAQLFLTIDFTDINHTWGTSKQESYVVVDGIYGTATTNAVKYFQAYEGITSDGIVGPQTWSYLNCVHSSAIEHNLNYCGYPVKTQFN